MRNLSILVLLTAMVALTLGPQATAVTHNGVFNGRNYLWLEAESYSSLGEDLDDNGWKIVSKETPIVSVQGVDILPASSNVSGTALLDDAGGGQHSDTAMYEVQFTTAGTYQFYSRHTLFQVDTNSSFGNEDSIFVSPAFNKNSESDWDGFEGLRFDDQDVDVEIPNPGFALDPTGFKPATSDNINSGWYGLRDWDVKSGGVLSPGGSHDAALWNGKMNWYNRPSYVGTGAGGGFNSDYGFKTEFIVTEGQVGQTLTFEIGSRENYGVFDGFLFIQDDNVDLLDIYTQEEVDAILTPPTPSLAGDFDNSGSVGNDDLTLLLDGWGGAPSAGWTKNAPVSVGNDSLTQLLDTWGNTALAGVGAVPEPSTLVMVGFSALLLAGRRRSV